MAESDRNAHVFVLHTWTEPALDGPGTRRGYVEHVATRRRRYFEQLDEALAFVDALTRAGGPPRFEDRGAVADPEVR